MKYKIFSPLGFFIVLYSSFIIPQWVSDPTNNLAICTADQTQRETEICRDNEGNVYVFWRDYRNEPSTFGGDIYAQKLNSNGEAQWLANGISVVTKSAAQFDVKALYDGTDGIYFVWRETVDLFSDYKIYAQRIRLDGAKLWGSNGILLQNISGKVLSHSVYVNENGDLLVSWQLGLSTPNTVDIYAQKINRDGIIQWTNNGMIICNTTGRYVYGSKIISDQNGGAYVCWSDNRTDLSNFDIYAQRVGSNGNILWAQNGIAVCSNQGNQFTKHIISDNNGGTMIFWEDTQQSSYSIYAQRIDSSGNKLLAADGKVLYTTATVFSQFEFIADRNNEIFFLWTNSDKNTYVQKVDYNGNFMWVSEIPICTIQSSVSYLAACASDVSGIIANWQDNRNGNYDIYTQWISSDGITMWENNGVPICNEVSEQTDYCICPDNFGGAVIAWADMRNGNFDIYTQNIDVRGELGSNKYFFQRSGLSKAINNLNTTLDSLLVTLPLLDETGYYSVTVVIDSILHPDVDELIITLTHLGINDTIIYELPGGPNLISCYLDDFASQNVSSSISPYTGIYKPYKSLAAFLNTDLNGDWIIEIKDNFAGNDGMLVSWGLIFNKGDITNIETNPEPITLKEYILNQNYPNPFNPSTSIQYAISSKQLVTLKVYDILGSEVATLVNEGKSVGAYEIKFDASKLSSGVYFYQLKAGNFVDTKKMILIK